MSDFTLAVVNVWGGECLGGERLTIMKPQELCQQFCQIINLELKKDMCTPQDAWAFAHELHFSVTQMPKYTEYFKTCII